MKKTFTILIAAIAAIMMMAQPTKVWAEDVTLTENFSSSRASSNNYDCGSNATTSGMQDDWNYAWTPANSVYVFKSGIRLGKGSGTPNTGKVTNTTMLSGISTGTSITIKVYAARWNTDSGNLTVTYNGSSESKAPSNSAITSTSSTYSASAFSSSTDFTITKVDDVTSFSIASSSKRIIIDKVEVVYSSGPTKYSVTYNSNGGTGTMTDEDSPYEAGETVTLLTNTFTKMGNSWSSWTVKNASNETISVSNNQFTMPASNVTVTANWTAKTISNLTYAGTPTTTLYYKGQTFDPTGVTVTATYTDASNEDVTSAVVWTPDPLDYGNTSVTGTYMGKTVSVPINVPGSADNPYDITQAKYAIDHSVGTSGACVRGIICQVDSYNSTYNSITYWISDDGTTTNKFEVYGGLSFDGGTAFSAVTDLQVGNVVVVNGNLTLYKTTYEFESNNHLVSLKRKVVYECNGGTSGCPESPQLIEDGSITLPAAPTYDCHTFGGWRDDAATPVNHEASSAYTVSKNVTFTAQWTLDNYTITYNTNGATSGSNVEINKDCGNSYNISDKPDGWDGPAGKPNLIKWNTKSDGSGDNYFIGDPITVSEDLTLYAQWASDPTYTVTIDDDIENGTITAAPSSAVAGTTITLTITPDECYQLKDLYVFDKDSKEVDILEGYTFVLPASNVTVMAEFEEKTVSIEYSVNGEIKNALTQTGLTCSATATLKTAEDLSDNGIAVPSGYTFAGWSTSAGSTEVVGSFAPTDDAVLYAVFEESGAGYVKVTQLKDITAGRYFIVNDLYVLPSSTTSSSPVKSNDYKIGSELENSYNSLPVSGTEWTFTGSNTAMTITNSDGKYLYVAGTSSNDQVRVNSTSHNWTFAVNSSGFSMKDNNNNRYCATYSAGSDWRSYNSATHSNYGDGGKLYLYKKVEGQTYTRILEYSSGSSSVADVTEADLITVKNGATLTVTGTCTGTPENIIIEDGGQLIVSTSGVKATFKKTIDATTRASYWNTISSPVGRKEISTVPNLVSGEGLTYNLYRYNETVASNQWEAYNLDNTSASYHSDFTHLEKGHGYLYRNNGPDIEYAGTVNTENVDLTLTASATALAKLKGFNLIGNPFGQNITMGNLSGVTLSGGYVLSNDGNWGADPVAIIHPCEGFLVQVAEETDITITKPVSKGTTYNREYIKFTVSNSQYEDAAFALFDKSYGLNKIEHRNPEIPMLYINKDNRDLAIATMSDNTKSFNLNFKAMTTGKYTLSYKATGEYNYLHVIDRLTGTDVDMLLEGEYSFIATPNDNENRFIVRLEYMPNYSEGNDEIFAFQNGDEILVSGEGELQIFDVTGRSVMTTKISGAESINLSAQGVYIFRLIGSEIKTQKIVVR